MGAITGQIHHQQDKQPLEGVEFALELPDGQKETHVTGSDGQFQFDGLAAGEYELVVTKQGFEDAYYGPLVVIEGVTTELTLALHPTQD